MNYKQIFYWLTVADNAKTFFGWFVFIFTAIATISVVVNLVARGTEFSDSTCERDKEECSITAKAARKWIMWSFPFMILFWGLYIFTPDKKDALLIVAGGGALDYLTTDSSAKQIPHEFSTFVLSELKNMAADTKVKLDLNNSKEKILNEAKQMTTEQLLDKMKIDSNFAKIVLNK